MDYADRGKLGIVYGDVTLGVHGGDFHLIFSYQTGGLESMVSMERNGCIAHRSRHSGEQPQTMIVEMDSRLEPVCG